MSRRSSLRLLAGLLLVTMLTATACGIASAPTPVGTASTLPTVSPSQPPATAEPDLPTASAHSIASVPPSDLPVLRDGPITPGRYTYELDGSCDDPACPSQATSPPDLDIELTVPAGWEAALDFSLIVPSTPSETRSPDGAGLVLGWTTYWVGLNSDPCLQVAHEIPDITVGPTVDDFVNALVAHPGLDVSEPMDIELGGYRGRFLSLTGPSDISDCDNWRPWDPGFYVQGPDNHWDIWVLDVDGFRVLIVTEQFPATPADIKAELRAMVVSIRFVR